MSRMVIADEGFYGLSPKILSYFARLPDHVLHNSKYHLLHPGAIYNKSFLRIFSAFNRVLSEMEKLKQSPIKSNGLPDYDYDKVLHEQIELLSSMQSHIDDCFNILKSCFSPAVGTIDVDEKFVDKWLVAAGHPSVRSFETNISAYRFHVSRIYNKIKHQGGRLRIIFLITNDVNVGYYLEGVSQSGALGPHPDVHPRNTAYSFARDLRYHFANICLISHHLHKSLEKAIGKITLKEIEIKTISDDNIEIIVKKICKIPFVCFPDEYNKKVPWVSYDSIKREIVVAYPSLNKPQKMIGPIRIMTAWEGDGFTKSFVLPYWKENDDG